jgi:predicted metal-binding membrane protein
MADALKRRHCRDRSISLVLLVGVILASWAYLLVGAGMGMSILEMTHMVYMDMPMSDMPKASMAWTTGHAVMMFFMWWVMMVAMMLPGASPMILLFATVNRGRLNDAAGPHLPTVAFTTSYLLCWGAFSLAATGLHWAVNHAGLLTPGMFVNNQSISAGILLAAGLYQLTPVKQACLRHCRSPAQYLANHWRPGAWGALRLGMGHGAYCLGCCWVLMLLLFVGGVMNLLWIAGLALYVLLEKAIPAGHWLSRSLGVALMVAGGWLLLTG